ncbi:hypothetical protein K470DRAFT_259078 [Piedraia hortae CBS 480.64]|uniref:Uncharacterized protein n=1 Tax=Piedraia hortae CBS 480.64 TaxID=1314780 RepID=A0A6A7BVG4_9PEZI|nr:hypothetical protein K470DRAFT_259078 [Piedraia hortae CBS 480.64]
MASSAGSFPLILSPGFRASLLPRRCKCFFVVHLLDLLRCGWMNFALSLNYNGGRQRVLDSSIAASAYAGHLHSKSAIPPTLPAAP